MAASTGIVAGHVGRDEGRALGEVVGEQLASLLGQIRDDSAERVTLAASVTFS